MSCLAALQYALFKDPNHRVFGNTDAAKCTAAIRLPDNSQASWADKGWWAEAWSDWTGGSPTPDAAPGGNISYNFTGGVQVEGSTVAENARASLRDNGNHQNPWANIVSRQSQNYGILIETRIKVNSIATSGFVFVGMLRAHASGPDLAGMERMVGIVSTAAQDNWRAICMRNINPNDFITPADLKKDTSLGIISSQANFLNCVIEVSGEGKSARWRTSTGLWTNNKIPIATTATAAELPSRRNEGVMDFGIQVREFEDDATPSAVATTAVVRRLNIWAWRPGFVATRPVFRFNSDPGTTGSSES